MPLFEGATELNYILHRGDEKDPGPDQTLAFDGGLVSGEEKLMKPDPAIYRRLCERYGVDPAKAVFIDDSLANVEGARRIGMHALHFSSVERLLGDLQALGVRV